MILITGAGGKTGLAAVHAAAQQGLVVRALVRRESRATAVREAGAAEIIIGDMTRAPVVRQAAEGVSAIYHIAPNMNPQEMHMGRVAIQAAQATGAHLVYHSVLHPHTEEMPHHWHKLRVEEQIFMAGIPFTILQPAPYMENVVAYAAAMQEHGVYAVPYPPETRLSLVALGDVAAVAAVVLANPAAHVGATYELVGTAALTQHAVAAVCGRVLGRPVVAQEVALLEWETAARAQGLSAVAIHGLEQMFLYYGRYGLVGNSNVLGWLLGRGPTALEDALRGKL